MDELLALWQPEILAQFTSCTHGTTCSALNWPLLHCYQQIGGEIKFDKIRSSHLLQSESFNITTSPRHIGQ